MKWVTRLEHSVGAAARNKGEHYFRLHKVHIELGSQTEVDATVQGTIPYTVEIRVDANTVNSFCTCPYFQTGEICKHVWATLLAAEGEGHLGRIESMWEPVVDNGLDGPRDLEEDSTYDFTP